MITPILMLGAGRIGGAILAGWRRAQAFDAADLMIRDPHATVPALEAVQAGAQLNPPESELARAKTVVLAAKPQIWREVAAETAAWLAADAVIISVAAGATAAICQGTASLYADDPAALARAHALFEPLGAVVDLTEEAQMHAATAVSGSAPAYLYAFIEALEAAGVSAGLPAKESARLARATITGAAALLQETGADLTDLRRQVTSPGGTTEAALNVLLSDTGLPPLLREAVSRAMRRSKELGG